MPSQKIEDMFTGGIYILNGFPFLQRCATWDRHEAEKAVLYAPSGVIVDLLLREDFSFNPSEPKVDSYHLRTAVARK